MTTEQLQFAVGIHAAAKLVALKSRMADTPAEREAEQLPASTLIDGLRQMLEDRKSSKI